MIKNFFHKIILVRDIKILLMAHLQTSKLVVILTIIAAVLSEENNVDWSLKKIKMSIIWNIVSSSWPCWQNVKGHPLRYGVST